MVSSPWAEIKSDANSEIENSCGSPVLWRNDGINNQSSWSARNSKTVNDYLIANSKLSKLFLDVRVQSDIESDQLLILAKLRFQSKWLHLNHNTARKENILHYETKLLNDKSIRQAHKQRIQQKLQQIAESSNSVL